MKPIYIYALALIIFAGCSEGKELVPPPVVTTPPVVVTPPNPQRIALSWEVGNQNAVEWSKKTVGIISANFPTYDAVEDITYFCPKYKSLTKDQKIKAHGEVIVGIVERESGFKPTSRMVETTMSIDPVTGKQVASEGLLQLSYQDMKNYGATTAGCGIDWTKDKGLAVTDPKKTIFNPLINLECGLRIYTRQLTNRKTILRPTGKGNGLYWAVISTNGKYTKKTQIAARVQSKLAACK